jgi:hypothetical protein
MKKQRMNFIDSARGVAMLFVFIGHFGWIYSLKLGIKTGRPMISEHFGLLASPAFIIISGLVVGFLSIARKNFTETRIKIIDRGIFLLSTGHLIMILSHVALFPAVDELWRYGLITDTIGLCLIIVSIAVSRMTYRKIFITGISLFIMNWFVMMFWQPDNNYLVALKEIFCGVYKTKVIRFSFPFLPWLGLFMVGSSVGIRIANYKKLGRPNEISVFLLKSAFISLFCALAIKIIYKAICYLCEFANNEMLYSLIADPYQRFPPSPVYFLFNAAQTYLIMYLIFHIEEKKLAKKLLDTTAMIGKTSLFVFVLQYYIYYIAFYITPNILPLKFFWPLYFFTSVILIIVLAKWWIARGYNRLLTVGYADWEKRVKMVWSKLII